MKLYSNSCVALSGTDLAILSAAMGVYVQAVDSDFTITPEYSDAVHAADHALDWWSVDQGHPIDAVIISVWYSAVCYYLDTTTTTHPAEATAMIDAMWPHII